MIGQLELKAQLNKNVPDVLMLVGEYGYGKHTVANYIAELLELPLRDASLQLDREALSEMYADAVPELLIIDMRLIGQHKRLEQAQNAILKFLEEPPTSKKIVVLVETPFNVLDTIRNRCQIKYLNSYTLKELREFNSDLTDEELRWLRTPARILNSGRYLVHRGVITSLCDSIVTSIGGANVSNTLTIVDKINFGDEEEKYDLDIFLETLLEKLAKSFYNNGNKKCLDALLITNQLISELKILNVNKRYMFENFILNLRETMACS